MLSRIYGTAFAKQEELDAYLKQIEEAFTEIEASSARSAAKYQAQLIDHALGKCDLIGVPPGLRKEMSTERRAGIQAISKDSAVRMMEADNPGA